MKETHQATNPVKNDHHLSRRELLKTLAAAGGALGASAFLPSEWTKPLVEAGVIPAHAQGTEQPLTITQVVAMRATAPEWIARADYDDPMGQVDSNALLSLWIPGCNLPVTQTHMYVEGSPFQGYISAFFVTNCSIIFNTTQICAELTINGRTSNTECGPFTTPVNK
jgi:hypothetical protein